MSDGMRYMSRLFVSLFRISPPRPRLGRAPLLLTVLGLVGAGLYGFAPASAQLDAKRQYSVAMLMARTAELSAALDGVEAQYKKEVQPIAKALMQYRSDNPRLVRRVSVSILRESKRTHIEPRLLVGMMLVENPALDPHARSVVGASGLMQVMPLHSGKWKPCGARLDDVEANICTGSQIFADALRSERGNVTEALLRYNGCVSGTNTPDCHAYPRYVLARARLVR